MPAPGRLRPFTVVDLVDRRLEKLSSPFHHPGLDPGSIARLLSIRRRAQWIP